MLIIGVDPGQNGALASISDNGVIEFCDIGDSLVDAIDWLRKKPGYMGMVGVVQVGKAVNLEEARKKAVEESARFIMNKDRFTKALEQVQ